MYVIKLKCTICILRVLREGTTAVWATCEQSCHCFGLFNGRRVWIIALGTGSPKSQSQNGVSKLYCSTLTLILDIIKLTSIMCIHAAADVAQPLLSCEHGNIHSCPYCAQTLYTEVLAQQPLACSRRWASQKASHLESTNTLSHEDDEAHHQMHPHRDLLGCSQCWPFTQPPLVLPTSTKQWNPSGCQSTENRIQTMPSRGGCHKAME